MGQHPALIRKDYDGSQVKPIFKLIKFKNIGFETEVNLEGHFRG